MPYIAQTRRHYLWFAAAALPHCDDRQHQLHGHRCGLTGGIVTGELTAKTVKVEVMVWPWTRAGCRPLGRRPLCPAVFGRAG